MKDRELIFGMIVAMIVVLLFMAVAMANLNAKLEDVMKLNHELGLLVLEQTTTQSLVIKALDLITDLTGIRPVERKIQKGWYEALKENIGRKVPLSYPRGWTDRYFNNLARSGAFRELYEIRAQKGTAQGRDAE